MHRIYALDDRVPYAHLAAVTVGRTPTRALVDSGNLLANVISEGFLQQLGIPVHQLKPVPLSTVGSAKKGATMEVLGQVPRPLELRFGGHHTVFKIQPIVLKHLSMPLNLSGPFLRKAGIDQIHSQSALRVKGTLVKLLPPQHRPSTTHSKPVGLYTIEEVTVPPQTQVWTRCRVPAVESGAIAPTEGLVEGNEALEEVYDVHTLRAAIVPVHQSTVPVPLLNTTDDPITIPANARYGQLVPQATQGPGIYNIAKGDDFPDRPGVPEWKRGPTTKANYEKRCNHLRDLFDLEKNPLLTDAEDLAKLLGVLVKNYEVFAHDGEYGRTDLIKHDIELVPGARPIRCANRPVNPALEENLKRQVLKWMKHHVVEPAQSPWAFPLVPVKKKTASGEGYAIRWCIDYRKLNAVTVPDAYAIGDPNHNLAQLARSTVFSTIDASGAFHQISIEEDKRDLTAFSTPFGQYRFRQMPFGVINGPSTYARLISRVLEGIPPSIALGYIDDVLVHARTLDEHADGLDQVLTAHRKAGLRLNPEKCHFAQPKVEYLGHLVSAAGIEPVPAYTELVRNWPMPTTRTQLRSFLGKVNYYRRFIRDFATRAAPLLDRLGQDGTKDKATFKPSEQFQDAFHDLRNALLEAPILGHPRFNEKESYFIVDTDWSAINAAIGGVLSQVQDGTERVIAYGGARLPDAKTRYAPQKGELFALLHFVNKWSYFLRYQPFVVRTDHSSLTYLKTMNHPDFMVQRWLATLANFQFEVKYRKGEKHGNADALSRAAHLPPFSGEPVTDDQTNLCNAIGLAPEVTTGMTTPGEARTAQQQDRDLREMRADQKRATLFDVPPTSPWAEVTPKVQIKDGVLYDDKDRLLIPQHMRDRVIRAAHHVMGHRGPKATKHRLGQAAIFPHMTKHIRHTLAACHDCQTKSKPTKQRTTLRPSTASGPFEVWTMDFVGPLPRSTKGYKYILTLRDVFTKWVEAFPTKDMTAATVVHHLVTDVFPRFGLPLKLHSDNGTQFTSESLGDVCRALGIKKTETPPYNPKSNMVERFHKDLTKALTALTRDRPSSWPDCLPLVLQATRAAPSETTGVSPFAATFGRDPPTDVALFFPFPKEKDHFRDLTDYAMNLRRDTQRVHDLIADATKAAVLARTAKYRGQLKKYPAGSRVYLFTPVTPPNASSKFANVYWSGPHTVQKQLNDLTYQLRSTSGKIYTASVDRLRPYGSGDPVDAPANLHSGQVKTTAPRRQQTAARHDGDDEDDNSDVELVDGDEGIPTDAPIFTPPGSPPPGPRPAATARPGTSSGSGSSDDDSYSSNEEATMLADRSSDRVNRPDLSAPNATTDFVPGRTSTEGVATPKASLSPETDDDFATPPSNFRVKRQPPPSPGQGRGRGESPLKDPGGASPALPTRTLERRTKTPPPPRPLKKPGPPALPFRGRGESGQQREYREMLAERQDQAAARTQQASNRAERAQRRTASQEALERARNAGEVPVLTQEEEGETQSRD